jgi:chromosome segregation ATPase
MLKLTGLFFVVILGVIFSSCFALAQEDNVTTATSALQDVLSILKQSVTKLAVDNDQLAAKDNYMKAQVSQLQMQLDHLQVQGDVLNKAAAQLHGNDPRRAQQIAQLEEENSDLDDRTKKAEDGIKLIQQSLDAGYQEDQKLLLQLKGMTKALSSPAQVQSPASQAMQRRQKEKLRLMKMIYDSQQRQESLHQSILEFQKNTPLLPAASALAHQQLLKEQIKNLEAQITAYPSPGPLGNEAYPNQWDAPQVHQLELELKNLENNYLQLKDLMEQMDKKAQSAKMTVSQRVEGEKLQSNIDELNHQSQGLRADLDNLRSQMIDLDKRKSSLEAMIQHLS